MIYSCSAIYHQCFTLSQFASSMSHMSLSPVFCLQDSRLVCWLQWSQSSQVESAFSNRWPYLADHTLPTLSQSFSTGMLLLLYFIFTIHINFSVSQQHALRKFKIIANPYFPKSQINLFSILKTNLSCQLVSTRPLHKNLFLEFPEMPGSFMLLFDR